MGKLTWIVTGLGVAASVVMTAAIRQQAARQQSAQAEALQEQAAQFAQATAEHTRLANLVAGQTNFASPSPAELKELLRLRNEDWKLRGLVGQKSHIETTNAQLREMAAKSEEAIARARALPNYWPKDQLTFAGYAEPESAVKSLLAAMKNRDLNAMLDCFPPAIQAEMEDSMKKDFGGDPAGWPAAYKAMMDGFMAGADGFHIVDQTATDSNEATINLSFDGEGRVQKMILRKTGDGWKYVGGD